MARAFMGTTLPNGIVLQVPDAPGLPDRSLTLASGANQEVPAAFFEDWMAAYANHPLVLDGIVYGAVDAEPEAVEPAIVEPVVPDHDEHQEPE